MIASITTLFKKPSPKIFCIGCNKTGTTSLETAFKDWGYRLGNQTVAERLLDSYLDRDFGTIIKYCRTAEVFQDAPFSFPHTFIPLHQAFPDAKFILSVRDSQEQWYDSMISFHTKMYGRLPDHQTILNSTYNSPGYMWKVRSGVFQITENMDMYDRETFLDYYRNHNYEVRNYFRNSPNFLELNVSETDSYKKLAAFIGREPLYAEFPWENKS